MVTFCRWATDSVSIDLDGPPDLPEDDDLDIAFADAQRTNDEGAALAREMGLAAESFNDGLRANADFVSAYQRFEVINKDLQQLITDWQTMDVGGQKVRNDHANADYDGEVLDRHHRLLDVLEVVLGAAFDAEYGKSLSNHLPMALVALQRLGAPDERLDQFAAAYAPRLHAAPPPVPWPAGMHMRAGSASSGEPARVAVTPVCALSNACCGKGAMSCGRRSQSST